MKSELKLTAKLEITFARFLRVWVIVEGERSRVEGWKSRVRSRGSRVASRGSHLEGRKSRVEGHRSRVGESWSIVKSEGSKFKCLYVSYHSKERSILVGTCWLNTKGIVKRLSLATPGKNVIFV